MGRKIRRPVLIKHNKRLMSGVTFDRVEPKYNPEITHSNIVDHKVYVFTGGDREPTIKRSANKFRVYMQQIERIIGRMKSAWLLHWEYDVEADAWEVHIGSYDEYVNLDPLGFEEDEYGEG